MAHPRVPLPDEKTGVVFEADGWRLYALTGLWADVLNRQGDLVLATPSARHLHATWDVSPTGTRSVEFPDDVNLPLVIHCEKSVHDWAELRAEVEALLPVIATRFSEPAPSNESLERRYVR